MKTLMKTLMNLLRFFAYRGGDVCFGKGGKKMYKFISILALSALVFGLSGMLRAENTGQGVMLEGRYIGSEEESPMEPVGQEIAKEGGGRDNVSALENLPVIEPDLIDQIRQMDPIELIRVIIFLDYQPHGVISAQAREKYASEVESIRQEARAIKASFARERRLDFPSDSENYDSPLLVDGPG
jgi:hypothetical protein